MRATNPPCGRITNKLGSYCPLKEVEDKISVLTCDPDHSSNYMWNFFSSKYYDTTLSEVG